MKRCCVCLMPDTARNIGFTESGVCLACDRIATRTHAKPRTEELMALADRHRSTDGSYDCIVPVSGGKDSFYQVYWMKVRLGMKPLLVSVTDDFEHTKAGIKNVEMIRRSFRCDMITLAMNPEMVRETTRAGFEKIGSTNWAIDKAIYAWPLQHAIKENIKLVVYGENVAWEYGSLEGVDAPSAKDQILNTVVNTTGIMEKIVDPVDMNQLHYPSPDNLSNSGICPVYLSYYTGWDGVRNMMVAKQYGFRGLDGEWNRRGYIDSWWQCDSVGYLMNYYLKYAKYGYSKATDVASHLVRLGYMSRKKAADIVREEEGLLDTRVLDDFLRVTGYSIFDFYRIMDSWWNRDIFEMTDHGWAMKETHKLVKGE